MQVKNSNRNLSAEEIPKSAYIHDIKQEIDRTLLRLIECVGMNQRELISFIWQYFK